MDGARQEEASHGDIPVSNEGESHENEGPVPQEQEQVNEGGKGSLVEVSTEAATITESGEGSKSENEQGVAVVESNGEEANTTADVMEEPKVEGPPTPERLAEIVEDRIAPAAPQRRRRVYRRRQARHAVKMCVSQASLGGPRSDPSSEGGKEEAKGSPGSRCPKLPQVLSGGSRHGRNWPCRPLCPSVLSWCVLALGSCAPFSPSAGRWTAAVYASKNELQAFRSSP